MWYGENLTCVDSVMLINGICFFYLFLSGQWLKSLFIIACTFLNLIIYECMAAGSERLWLLELQRRHYIVYNRDTTPRAPPILSPRERRGCWRWGCTPKVNLPTDHSSGSVNDLLMWPFRWTCPETAQCSTRCRTRVGTPPRWRGARTCWPAPVAMTTRLLSAPRPTTRPLWVLVMSSLCSFCLLSSVRANELFYRVLFTSFSSSHGFVRKFCLSFKRTQMLLQRDIMQACLVN